MERCERDRAWLQGLLEDVLRGAGLLTFKGRNGTSKPVLVASAIVLWQEGCDFAVIPRRLYADGSSSALTAIRVAKILAANGRLVLLDDRGREFRFERLGRYAGLQDLVACWRRRSASVPVTAGSRKSETATPETNPCAVRAGRGSLFVRAGRQRPGR